MHCAALRCAELKLFVSLSLLLCAKTPHRVQATRRWFRGRGLRTHFRAVITSLASKQAPNSASGHHHHHPGGDAHSASDTPALALCAEIARFLAQLFAQHMRSDLKGAPELVAAGAVKAAAAKLSYLSPSKADAAKRQTHETPKKSSSSAASHFDDDAASPSASAAVAAAVASATPSSSAAVKRDAKGRPRKNSQHTKVVDALYVVFELIVSPAVRAHCSCA